MKTKIQLSKDCGNSPKQQFLQDLSIAIARADQSSLEKLTSEDVQWYQSGRSPLSGRSSFMRTIKDAGPVDTIQIHDVVSHGKKGAVRGSYQVSGKARNFCHFFEFTNHKCTEVHSIHTMSTAARGE